MKYDFIVTFDCAYVYFRYLFLGFERMVVGIKLRCLLAIQLCASGRAANYDNKTGQAPSETVHRRPCHIDARIFGSSLAPSIR
jgi:hypothetical protein